MNKKFNDFNFISALSFFGVLGNEPISLSEKCPCGSDEKFEKCCYLNVKNSENLDIRSIEHLQYLIAKNMEKAENETIKELGCLYPDKSSCNGNPINSHLLQKNRILSSIQDDGHVLVFNYKNFLPNNDIFDEVGINKATVFKGFCNKHDTELFIPIEHYDYNNTLEQNFLFAYKSINQEYYSKKIHEKTIRNMFKKMPHNYKDPLFVERYRTMLLELNDIDYYKSEFDIALLAKNYNIIDSKLFCLDSKINFAASTSFIPEFDIDDNIFIDIYSKKEKRLPIVFLTVFPQNEKTYILFSWLKEDIEALNRYVNQLSLLEENDIKEYINKSIPKYTENFAINPAVWKNKTEEEKNTFIDAFLNIDIGLNLISDEEEVFLPLQELVESKLDLFSF